MDNINKMMETLLTKSATDIVDKDKRIAELEAEVAILEDVVDRVVEEKEQLEAKIAGFNKLWKGDEKFEDSERMDWLEEYSLGNDFKHGPDGGDIRLFKYRVEPGVNAGTFKPRFIRTLREAVDLAKDGK